MTVSAEIRTGRTHVSEARRAGFVVEAAAGDEGYVLLAVLMLLALTIAAPKVAMQLKHDQELETMHRANQYVRAIRLFHKKTGNYPTSIEQLEKTNNQRFLRQRYLDPLTGKDDWRLIQVGQNKTTVKGLFGKDLPGLGGGLGAAAGMQSNMGGSSTTGSSFGSSSSFGSGSGPGGSQTAGNTTGGPGAQTGSGSGSGTPGGGVQSTDATDFKGSTGPIMGVGVPKDGEAFLTVNGVSTYQEWEFLYDPRIEQLYSQNGSATGGGSLGTAPPSTGLNGLGQPGGGQPGGGVSNGPFGGGNGNPGGGGTPPPPPTGTPPQ
jgi:type II secretory pathway pseudopilin PulG